MLTRAGARFLFLIMILRAGLGQPFDYRNEFAKIQLMLLTANKECRIFLKQEQGFLIF